MKSAPTGHVFTASNSVYKFKVVVVVVVVLAAAAAGSIAAAAVVVVIITIICKIVKNQANH